MKTIRKPRFLCDADGIVADFVKAAIQVMNRLSGQTIMDHMIVNWEVTEVLEDPKHRDEAKAEFNKAGFCAAFEAYDGAQSAVRILNSMTDFHFVTAPMIKNLGWMPERMEWLVHHFEVLPGQVNFISNKHIAKGDFLLEDSEKNLTGWLEEHQDGIPVLWDRPWNRVPVDPRVVRVSTWAEVIDLVDKIIQKQGR